MRKNTGLQDVRPFDSIFEERPLLTTQDVARLLNVVPSTVKYWRTRWSTKPGPRFMRLGAVVRYSWPDVKRYLKSQIAPIRPRKAAAKSRRLPEKK